MGTITEDNPALALEWHPTKNGKKTPNQFLTRSNKKVWWLGKCGHEWETTVDTRNRGAGCPYCSNHKVLAGFNDLATTHHELLTQWDYEKTLLILHKLMLVLKSAHGGYAKRAFL